MHNPTWNTNNLTSNDVDIEGYELPIKHICISLHFDILLGQTP